MDQRTHLYLDRGHVDARIAAFEREAAEIRAARRRFRETGGLRATGPAGLPVRARAPLGTPHRWLRCVHALHLG